MFCCCERNYIYDKIMIIPWLWQKLYSPQDFSVSLNPKLNEATTSERQRRKVPRALLPLLNDGLRKGNPRTVFFLPSSWCCFTLYVIIVALSHPTFLNPPSSSYNSLSFLLHIKCEEFYLLCERLRLSLQLRVKIESSGTMRTWKEKSNSEMI